MNVVLWLQRFLFTFLLFFLFLSIFLKFFCGSSGFFLGFFFGVFFSSGSFSFFFLLVLFFVWLVVTIFSSFYNQSDFFSSGFILRLIVFVGSIIIFVFRERWFLVFFGWEGLGVRSLLLIGWYSSIFSSSSCLKTAFINRVGDIFLLFSGILWYFFIGRWASFFFLVFAGIVKSAQFPFFAWLPAAMAAPTPVSSLVHSSTLVTAGVWLLFSSGFESILFLVFGLISSVYGGLMAVWEVDLKKVVAFSTLSQLGFMFLTCCIISEVCICYLFVHAFFKSFLFVLVGVIIALSVHNQSLGFFFGFFIPFLKFFFIIGLFSMVGFFFFSGFFLKHFSGFYLSEWGGFFWFLFFLVCFVTGVYRFRLFRFLFCVDFFTVCSSSLFFLSVPFGVCVFTGFLFSLELNSFPFFSSVSSFLVFIRFLLFYLIKLEISFFYLLFLSSIFFIRSFLFLVDFSIIDESFLCVLSFFLNSVVGFFFVGGVFVYVYIFFLFFWF